MIRLIYVGLAKFDPKIRALPRHICRDLNLKCYSHPKIRFLCYCFFLFYIFMADQQTVEKEELAYEEPQQKRTIIRKYARPIEFVSESSKISEKDTKRQKTSSSGDQVASFYRSIISASSSKPKISNNTSTIHDSNKAKAGKAAEETRWCKSCSQAVPKADYKRHIQGTAHMVSNTNSEPAVDTLTLNGKNVGFKMLQSQGWKYEEGLGPEGEGRRHPIATVLKQDRLGIGHEETGRKVVTHKYKEIEQKAIARQRLEAESQKDPGKEIARKAKAETERRAAILRYMKS